MSKNNLLSYPGYSPTHANSIILQIFIFFLIGYFLGSVLFAQLISSRLFARDLTKTGSKNMGATNFARVHGIKLGFLVTFLDVSKACLAVSIAGILRSYVGFFADSYIIFAGLGAFVGHSFSMFYGFKGGKGVSVGLGIVFAFNYRLALILIFVWFMLLIIIKYQSGAVMLTWIIGVGLTFVPVIGGSLWTKNLPSDYNLAFSTGTALIALASIALHRPNIIRILNGNEPKINFIKITNKIKKLFNFG